MGHFIRPLFQMEIILMTDWRTNITTEGPGKTRVHSKCCEPLFASAVAFLATRFSLHFYKIILFNRLASDKSIKI